MTEDDSLIPLWLTLLWSDRHLRISGLFVLPINPCRALPQTYRGCLTPEIDAWRLVDLPQANDGLPICC